MALGGLFGWAIRSAHLTCGFLHTYTVRSLHISDDVVVQFFLDAYHDIVCITAFIRPAIAKAVLGFLDHTKWMHMSEIVLC